MSAETLADLARVIPWVQNGKNPALTLDPARAQLLLEALERARVVGVLDAWAGRCEGSHRTSPPCDSVHDAACHLMWHTGKRTASKTFGGRDSDAARIAAAKAIESGEV